MPKTTKLKMRLVTMCIQSINADRLPAKTQIRHYATYYLNWYRLSA